MEVSNHSHTSYRIKHCRSFERKTGFTRHSSEKFILVRKALRGVKLSDKCVREITHRVITNLKSFVTGVQLVIKHEWEVY